MRRRYPAMRARDTPHLMAARYLTSDFQRSLLSTIEQMDRTGTDFFVQSPLVIDCRDDTSNFEAQLTPHQRDFIVFQYEKKNIRLVSSLARPAYSYARSKLREKFEQLDADAVRKIDLFLHEWGNEIGIAPGQAAKPIPNYAAGIDILLPKTGIRLTYDWTSLKGL